jgi:hypothetical protein
MLWVATSYSGQLIEPADFESKPIFGSEHAMLEVFQRVAKKRPVTIFITKPAGYQFEKYGIIWRSEHDWNTLVKTSPPTHVVIMRYMGVFCDFVIPKETKIYLYVHDVFPHPAYRGQQLSPNFTNNMARRLTKIVTVGDSQVAEIILPQFKLERSLFQTIKNGINPVPLANKPRAPMSFVYASGPDRGLVKLLNIWPRILVEWPYATLQIFHNLSDQDKEHISRCFERVAPMGKVNQKTLFEKLQNIDYWVYPCTFFETCCTTAIEMAYHGPICITNDLGALKENNSGVIIKRDPTQRAGIEYNGKDPIDTNFEEDLFMLLRRLEDNPEEKLQIRKAQHEWAKNQTWDSRADEWLTLLN